MSSDVGGTTSTSYPNTVIRLDLLPYFDSQLTPQQGIAWHRSRGRNGSIHRISRKGSQVVEMRVLLENCSWDVPTKVGAV